MRHLRFTFFTIIALILHATTIPATVRYVKANATGNGNSWADASGDLQAVINVSASGDSVWVAAGTYVPNRPADNLTAIAPGNRNNAFVVKENIHLFGGFAGTETGLSERNWETHLTLLSGETGNPGLGDNAYHVVIFVRTDGATLDGFTITGGNADGNGQTSVGGTEVSQNAGGGMYNVRAQVNLNHLTLTGNAATNGGGVYNFHSFPSFTNIAIHHNTATQAGGMYNYYSFPVLTNVTVSDNNTGGGIYNDVSNPQLVNSIVRGNGVNVYNDLSSQPSYSFSLIESEVTRQAVDDNPASSPIAANALYVSTDGNDANVGTLQSPLATLKGARDKIREIQTASGLPAGGITVYVRGGSYPVTETIPFETEDSGTESAPIIYAAYPGETPVFTGGVYIKGDDFGKVTDPAVLSRLLSPEARDRIVAYNLFEHGFTYNDLDYSKGFWANGNIQEYEDEERETIDISYYTRRMQVYIDDEALYQARYPNKVEGSFAENPYDAYLPLNEVLGGRGWDDPGWDDVIYDGKDPVFRTEETRIKQWKNYDDIIISGMMGVHFEHSKLVAKTIDPVDMTVALKRNSPYGLDSAMRYMFENVFEELDRPGEYYIDKNTGILYLYPTKDMSKATVKVSKLDVNYMVTAIDASYLTFSGLTFELTKGAVMWIRGGQHCTVEHCTLKNFSVIGIRLGDYTTATSNYVEAWNLGKDVFDECFNERDAAFNGLYHAVRDNTFLNTGYHACRIAVGHPGNRDGGYALFEGNTIKHSGLFGSTYRSGLSVDGSGITIKNNSFYYCKGQAINGVMIDTEIVYNEFCDSPSDMAEDTGTIYMNYRGTNEGTRIRYNFFHDVTNMDNRYGLTWGHALRGAAGSDSNAPYQDFCYNVVYNYPGQGGPSFISPQKFINNIFIDCDEVMTFIPESYSSYEGITPQELLARDTRQSAIADFYQSGLYDTPHWRLKFPEMYEYLTYLSTEKTNLLEPMDEIYDNLIVNINKPFHSRNSELSEMHIPEGITVDANYGKIENNHYLYHDPGFPSLTNRNFQLPHEVFDRYGMTYIDMSLIGADAGKKEQTLSTLPVTTALVHNDTELKDALADGTIDKIILANDIAITRTDLVIQPRRARPGLTIDGNEHTLTDFFVPTADATKSIRLETKGDLQTITLRSIRMTGQNGAGSLCITAAEPVDVIAQYVTFTGPKLLHNPAGTLHLENCGIHIALAAGGAFAGEMANVNRISFTDSVRITKDYDSDDVQEAVIKLSGNDPSLTVKRFYRLTDIKIDYLGLPVPGTDEVGHGGGGMVDAANPFDFTVGDNSWISYTGYCEYLPGAKSKSITLPWNSGIDVTIHPDVQRGVVDKVFTIDGDLTVGSLSGIAMTANASADCLLEVKGNLHLKPGSYMWLSMWGQAEGYERTAPARHPVIYMQGGPASSIFIERTSDISIVSSDDETLSWKRCIGFEKDGVFKMTVDSIWLSTKNLSDAEPRDDYYYAALDRKPFTIEARITGGEQSVTQSFTCTSPTGSTVPGMSSAAFDMMKLQRLNLYTDITEEEYAFLLEGYEDKYPQPGKEIESVRPVSEGNIDAALDPLFVDAPHGNYRLQPSSPVIDAGDNQRYQEARSLTAFTGERDLAGRERLWGERIDLGAFEYQLSDDPDPDPDPNPNAVLPVEDVAVWSYGNHLYLRTSHADKARIYTITGQWVKQLDVPGGLTSTPLPHGIYIVKLKDGAAWKVAIR